MPHLSKVSAKPTAAHSAYHTLFLSSNKSAGNLPRAWRNWGSAVGIADTLPTQKKWEDFNAHTSVGGNDQSELLHEQTWQRLLNCHLYEVKDDFNRVIFHIDRIAAFLYIEVGVSVSKKSETTENVAVFV